MFIVAAAPPLATPHPPSSDEPLLRIPVRWRGQAVDVHFHDEGSVDDTVQRFRKEHGLSEAEVIPLAAAARSDGELDKLAPGQPWGQWEADEVWGGTRLDPSDVYFVQVGANCGTPRCANCGESIWLDARKYRWRGLVIEANPEVYPMLRANYAEFNPAVRALNVALADRDGLVTLHVPIGRHNIELASLDPTYATRIFGPAEGETLPVQVQAVTLESLWRREVESDRVDILQLDLIEHTVLLATNFSALAPRKPRYLLYKHFHIPPEAQPRVLAHLQAAGYQELKRLGGCRMFPLDILMELHEPEPQTLDRAPARRPLLDDARPTYTSTCVSSACHARRRAQSPPSPCGVIPPSTRLDTLDVAAGPDIELAQADDRIVDTARIVVGLWMGRTQRDDAFRVLDIGGDSFGQLASRFGWKYVTIDLETPQARGTGGHQPNTTHTYDGRHLPYADGAFDVVIMSFMLHHAAEHAIPLLQQAAHITTAHVVVGEDLAATDYPEWWHRRNFEHAPGGLFRSDGEWRALYELVGLRHVRSYNIRNWCDMYVESSLDEQWAHVFRRLYLLKREAY